MKTGGLIAIGGAYVDINAPQFPIGADGLSLETEVVGGNYVIEPGGSAVNFARMCASLELPTTFIGKVGKDTIGDILSNLLIKQRITPLLVSSNEVSSNVSFNMVNKAGKSIMAVVGTANQSLTPDEVYAKVSERLHESEYLFLGGCFKLKQLMPAFLRLAKDAKKTGVKIVLDHARLNKSVTEEDKETVRQLALLSDIYLPSSDEFKQLWDVSSIEDGLWMLKSRMDGIAIVKNGSEGAMAIIDGDVDTIPAFSVTPIHTIGAGDSFNAGVITARYEGKSIRESIVFGSATAALKISRKTLPTHRDVVDFLSTHTK